MFGVEARKSVTAVVLAVLSVLHLGVLADDVGGRQRLDVSKLPQVANPGERLLDAYREVRQHVGERYAEQKRSSKDLICGSPANVGFQKKLASGAQMVPFPAVHAAKQKFHVNDVPVLGSCQVYVSHKYRFVYVRQPKSSSTAVLGAIREQLCRGNCSSAELQPMHMQEVDEKDWNEYFVFTVVRNPWTRILSSYKFLHKYFMRRKEVSDHGIIPGDKCGMDFGEFAKNAHQLATLCDTEQCCPYIQQRKKWNPAFVDVHITDQSSCTFVPNGESMVDYIGTTETLNDDWKQIVQEISEHYGLPFGSKDVQPSNGDGKNRCSEDAAKHYYDAIVLKNIALQYSMDVQRFGYL